MRVSEMDRLCIQAADGKRMAVRDSKVFDTFVVIDRWPDCQFSAFSCIQLSAEDRRRLAAWLAEKEEYEWERNKEKGEEAMSSDAKQASQGGFDYDEAIDALLAAKEGEAVQFAFRADKEPHWCDTDSPIWNFERFCYRRKPKPPGPREWWENVYPGGRVARHLTPETAEAKAAANRIECVHVREVLD